MLRLEVTEYVRALSESAITDGTFVRSAALLAHVGGQSGGGVLLVTGIKTVKRLRVLVFVQLAFHDRHDVLIVIVIFIIIITISNVASLVLRGVVGVFSFQNIVRINVASFGRPISAAVLFCHPGDKVLVCGWQ